MDIRVGTELITGATVFGENIYYGDASRPAHKIELPGELTAAQLAALLSEPWELLDDAGNVQGIHEGYNTLYKHELTLVKVQPLEQAVTAAEERATAAEQSAETATAAVEQAQLDYDSMLLDHEYRLTLIELLQDGGETA